MFFQSQTEQDRFTTCFNDLWSRFIILGGGSRVQSPFGAKTLQTDKHTGLAASDPCIKKTHAFNAEKNDFDQQTACKATIHWSKNTTLVTFIVALINLTRFVEHLTNTFSTTGHWLQILD